MYWWHRAEAVTACVNINRWVFEHPGEGGWWHRQPSARAFISYAKLLEKTRRTFDALPAEAKERMKEPVRAFQAELMQLMEQQQQETGGAA